MTSTVVFGDDSCFESGDSIFTEFSASTTNWAFNVTDYNFGNYSNAKNVTGYLSSAFPYMSIDSD